MIFPQPAPTLPILPLKLPHPLKVPPTHPPPLILHLLHPSKREKLPRQLARPAVPQVLEAGGGFAAGARTVVDGSVVVVIGVRGDGPKARVLFSWGGGGGFGLVAPCLFLLLLFIFLLLGRLVVGDLVRQVIPVCALRGEFREYVGREELFEEKWRLDAMVSGVDGASVSLVGKRRLECRMLGPERTVTYNNGKEETHLRIPS